MAGIPAALRRLVIKRANNHCEYCGLDQISQVATFHIDHVIPTASGGETSPDNLALACVSCSLRKGARLSATDPQTGAEVPLYNPRQEVWRDHFQWDGVRLVGTTPTGRATVFALAMNRPTVLLIRQEEVYWGRHPYPSGD
ncbi:MAG: HNH endonuclease [Anaerolineae bacterium]|nr:HNH endonuclease [Promineifilum sp.]MCZ2114404.1 HNH endonuclease [Anaerolineae bacterium]